MNEADFNELIESVREAGRILRGEVVASREFPMTPDVQAEATDEERPIAEQDGG